MKKYLEIEVIGAYLLLFAVTIITIGLCWYSGLFTSANFLYWDAEHYNYIRENGYLDFRVAFFPLFPLVWKFLHLNVHGMVFVNAAIYLISFYFLVKELKISKVEEILVYLTIPSFIFFYLPFSESIFFLCSVILLSGLINKRDYLVYLGLFLATLSRPAFTIFVPSLVIMELLSKDRGRIYARIGLYLVFVLAGLALVGLIQYLDTGEWFKFFSAQKSWGNELQVPKLPLTSWAGGWIVRLDGFAFLIGALAGCVLTAFILKLKGFKDITIPREVVFSLAYLSGITLSVLLFRGGSLFSLNRFVFATPFIIVALNFWINKGPSLRAKQLLIFFGLIFLFWLLLGSYVHIRQIVKYTLMTLYALLIFALNSDNRFIKRFSFPALILANFIFQVFYYLRFLNGGWVG